MQTQIRLPNFGIQMRLTDDRAVDRFGPPHVLRLLHELEDADLRFQGPDAWGAAHRLLQVVGRRRDAARAAEAAAGTLDLRARQRLAREGCFTFGRRGCAPDVHVRVISRAEAEALSLLEAAFRLAELRFAGPGWRYVATRKQEGFRTTFTFVVRPSVAWLIELLAKIAARLGLKLRHEMEQELVVARIGNLDVTFGA